MKSFFVLTMMISLPVFFSGQSLSPFVIASSGDYFTGAGTTLSWTLGEPVTETLSGGGIILAQGFQQPFGISLTGIDLNLLVYLEGPFNGTSMNQQLTGLADFPLSQPYNTSPWFYSGTETVASIPEGVVDWILIELRDATSAVTATAETTIARQASFLMNNGNIRTLDGNGNLQFDSLAIQHSLFAVVYHRNHLAIMSAGPITESGGIYSYDFSTPGGQAFGTDAQKNLSAAVYGMYSGDAVADGIIDQYDKTSIWVLQAGTTGYAQGDMDLNRQVNHCDKNEKWLPNLGEHSQVPE